ncbi:MAG: pirin family protein, partial [Halomonas sp.]
HEAPTLAFSPLVGADMLADAETTVHLDLYKGFEYGVLVLEGSLRIGQDTFSPNELAYLGCGLDAIALELDDDTRVLLLGGEPLNEEIFIWWNFVGHSKAEIAQAQQEWEAGDTRFGDVPEFDGDRLMPPPIPWRMMSDT